MSTTNILDLNNRIDELEKNSGGGGSADSAKRSDIATEFSTETSYTAGNFVYHDGKLYQFNADHSAGAWDPTDVVEANVTDQIVSNKSAIDGLTASDVAYDNTDSGLTATDVQGAVDEVKGTVDDLASAVPRTKTGTTLADLIAAIDSLTDIQKINARVQVWANVLSIFQLPENGYAYNFVEVAGDGTLIEYRLSKGSGVSKLQSLITNGATTTTSELTVTSWTLYYQGAPIS